MEGQKIEEIRDYLNSRGLDIKSVRENPSEIVIYLSNSEEYLQSTAITDIGGMWLRPVWVGIRKGWLIIVLGLK